MGNERAFSTLPPLLLSLLSLLPLPSLLLLLLLFLLLLLLLVLLLILLVLHTCRYTTAAAVAMPRSRAGGSMW